MMKTINEKSNLTTPVCIAEGDFKALLLMDKMIKEGIPVVFNTQNLILYTNNEENAEKARYLLFTCA